MSPTRPHTRPSPGPASDVRFRLAFGFGAGPGNHYASLSEPGGGAAAAAHRGPPRCYTPLDAVVETGCGSARQFPAPLLGSLCRLFLAFDVLKFRRAVVRSPRTCLLLPRALWLAPLHAGVLPLIWGDVKQIKKGGSWITEQRTFSPAPLGLLFFAASAPPRAP
jgi:hypothetical protein